MSAAESARWTLPTGFTDSDEENQVVAAPATSEDIELAAEQLNASSLKGEELEKALEDADLPKTGTADEKRARLAEHLGTAGKE